MFATDTDAIAAQVFLAIAVVVVLARVMGALARRLGQPAVVGEILAGILLGPTFLGAFGGHLDERLFPFEIRPFLEVVAQLGLVIFMFIVGLELDLKLIRGKERVAGIVSVSSVTMPFVLGIVLAAGLFSSYDVVNDESIKFLPFALFIGASMSVTAFPVLARILTERGMHRTEVGALTLACAAVDDILAWSLLAVVVAIVEAGSFLDLPRILLSSAAFIAFMFLAVRPLLAKLTPRYREVGRLTPAMLSIVLVGMLISSYITWRIGIHAIFGAFLFGVVMPRQDSTELHHAILERLESVSVLLLLPVFFVVTGLSVNVRDIGASGLVDLVLILLVACLGKFFGAAIAARVQGLPSRKASAIGVLMNTRGLTELVILNIGLAAGVLTGQLFTLLVLMALITTWMTTPLLRAVYPDAVLQRDIEEAEKAALGAHVAHRVLVPLLGDVDDDANQATIGVAIDIAAGGNSEIVLSRFVDSRRQLEIGSGLGVELASMAQALDVLHDVAAQADQRGAHAVVRSQFSSDPATDLLAQLTLVDPDLVLLAAPGATDRPGFDTIAVVEALVRSGVADVALVQPGTTARGGAVGVQLEGDEDEGALIEVAARIGRGRATSLVLAGLGVGRRTDRAVANAKRALLRAGVAMGGDDGPGPVSVVVRNASTADVPVNGAACVVVRARPEIAPPTVTERLQRLDGATGNGTGNGRSPGSPPSAEGTRA